MNEVFEQSVIQPLTSLSEKARPGRSNRVRISSRYYAGILEQLSFVLCLDMQRNERRMSQERKLKRRRYE